VRWFLKAAAQGNVSAQYNLSIMHAHGQGVSKDLEESARWTREAAEQGHAKAQDNLMSILLYYLELASKSKFAVGLDASSYTSMQCESCGRGCESGVKLKPYSRCKEFFYCGQDCQREHWKKGHQLSYCAPPEK
jgi:TPR repeat protein